MREDIFVMLIFCSPCPDYSWSSVSLATNKLEANSEAFDFLRSWKRNQESICLFQHR